MLKKASYMGLKKSIKLWLMYKKIIPKPNMLGLKVGDRVKVIAPYLNYGEIGVILKDESPDIFQWQFQFLYVEFPDNDFREYFMPDELEKVDD